MNDFVVLNDAILARFAKGERARAALVHERAILDLVRRYVQVPVPQVEQLHDDVMIYGFIPGAPLTQDALLQLDVVSQDRIAEQLTLFLGS